MFRKITLIPLVLFGFLLSGIAGKCLADVSVELEQAKSDVISLIETGNYEQAKAQAEGLIADFSSDPDLPKVICKIAEEYRWSTRSAKDKYEYAKIFYEQVIQSYPDSVYADKAALGISKGEVLSLIVSQDFDAAGQALDEMVASFPDHPNLPSELFWIGKGFGYWERHENEKSAYQYIIQNYPDSTYADRAQLGFARANVQSLIMSQDYNEAKKALKKMTADFPEYPDFPEALYWIAERYIWADRFEDATSIYQQIIQNYPGSSFVDGARVGLYRAIALSHVMSQDYDGADAILNKMIAECNDYPDLPKMLLNIAEQCYNQGFSNEKDGLEDRTKNLFRKAATIYEMVEKSFPDYSATPNKLCWLMICYRAIDDYEKSTECCQKLLEVSPDYKYAWQAQSLIGCNYRVLKRTGAISRSEADAKTGEAYQRLLENYPDCPVADTARQWLAYNSSKKERSEAK